MRLRTRSGWWSHVDTANIYTEMASDTIRAELKKPPWIDENGVQVIAPDHALKHAPFSGAEGQTVSGRGKVRKGGDSEKYVDSPLKRRVLASLDTLRQELEMVDATGVQFPRVCALPHVNGYHGCSLPHEKCYRGVSQMRLHGTKNYPVGSNRAHSGDSGSLPNCLRGRQASNPDR